MAKTKYKSGQLYKHNAHNFVIRVITIERFDKVLFEVVKGTIPPNCYPRSVWEMDFSRSYLSYSKCTIRTKFTLISGIGAEILYGIKAEKSAEPRQRNGEGS